MGRCFGVLVCVCGRGVCVWGGVYSVIFNDYQEKEVKFSEYSNPRAFVFHLNCFWLLKPVTYVRKFSVRSLYNEENSKKPPYVRKYEAGLPRPSTKY